MSDTPPGQSDPQRNPDGPGGGADGKPKRRRRRRKKSGQGAQGAQGAAPAGQQGPSPQGAEAAAPATPAIPKKRPPVRRNRPKPPPVSAGTSDAGTADRPARGKGPGRSNDGRRSGPQGRDDRPRKGAPAPGGDTAEAPAPRKKKKRKVRTKDCVACYTPHVTIHRVNLSYRKQWSFICDMCWADRCVDNPHYEYGGLWMSGRVMPPESELYAQWLAKRNQHKRGPDAKAGPESDAAQPSDHGAPKNPEQAEHAAQETADDASAVATLPEPPQDAAPPPVDAPSADPQDN